MLKCKEIYDVSQTKNLICYICRFSERCWVNIDPHLPEPLSDCLEDGLTSNDAILIDQDGGHHPVFGQIFAVSQGGLPLPMYSTDK